ncbi:MAG: M48 family metallopeptidase [Candidatus Omnitrophota bacterium]
MLRRLKIFSAASIVFLLSGCTTIYNPATQRRETYFIGTQNEIALGRDMDLEIQKKMRIMQDQEMQLRLGKIAKRIAAASDRQDLIYTFKIIKDKELNAFSIPGGYVYVNTGLMDMATDDELSCVLAHEVGHIAARHSVKKLQAVMGYEIIMGIALGVSGQQSVAQATDIIFNIGSLGYSRKDELLADRLAVRYSKNGGYSPYGMIGFFEKLKEEESKRGPNLKIHFLSSHPDLDLRIQKVKEEIASSQ